MLGAEATADGLWLYWQALQANIPDLQAAIKVRTANGQIVAEQDSRPIGYDFPTTRWQPLESYPALLSLAPGLTSQALTLEINVYEAESGRVIGFHNVQVPALPGPPNPCCQQGS